MTARARVDFLSTRCALLDSTSHHAPTSSPYVLLFAAIVDTATHSSSVVLRRPLSSAPRLLCPRSPYSCPLIRYYHHTHVRSCPPPSSPIHMRVQKTRDDHISPLLSRSFLLLSLLFRQVLATKMPTSPLFE
ncbi:hypothetical protein TcWFU_008494 [Taenia crassiceps]|uniref:Uncharacterized protein n=1 Tax=Taenia crassiceps TaxID=6207 RepID=A0ABR4QSJ6_9CEST